MVLKTNHINSLIFVYLTCYVLGPAPINILVTLLSIVSVYIIFKNILNIKFEKIQFFLIVFSIYILIKEFFSQNFNFDILSTFRYLIIFAALYFIKSEKIKCNFYIFLFISLIAIDGYIQFFHGTNILGYSKHANVRLTGFFDDEPILGSFLMKFIFPFLAIFLFDNKKSKVFILISIILIYILIFLTGERMAFIQSSFGFVSIFIFLFYKKYFNLNLKIFFISSFILLCIFLAALLNQNINDRYKTTIYNISNLNNIISNDKIRSSEKDYLLNFYTGLKIFYNKPLFGNGFRYYNTNCADEFYEKYLSEGCSTHPHNIYIEILSDHGTVGLFIFILFLYNLYFNNLSRWNYKHIDGYAITSLIMTFPLFTSQSIFSSYYGSIFFLFIYLTYLNSKSD